MYTLTPAQRRQAEAALDKPAAYGADIDLNAYKQENQKSVDKDTALEAETLTKAGYNVDASERSGSFLQVDHHTQSCSLLNAEGIELMPTRQALETYDGLPDYMWQALPVDQDKYTARAALDFDDGYFIRAKAGSKAKFPVQACMFMAGEGVLQNVHNIIVVEEGAELEIISGCATSKGLKQGLHLGISEFYVHKNARLTFTMIHNWGDEIVTRPRSGAIVEEGGVFVSNYICMKKVKDLQMYPTARLVGDNATARFNSVVAAPSGAHLDTGARVILGHPGCRAEVVSRAVSFGGDLIARGHLLGEAPQTKAHLECHGLMLNDNGRIHAIPELESRVTDAEMSHEAAVGKIAQEEVEYLMARGLDEEEATSTIVRGFLNVEIAGLPQTLQRDLDRLIEQSNQEGAM